jgi:uracil phosphoribosyltransferase
MLKVLNHPLITHKLTQMRKVSTGTKDFRENLDEIAGLMAYEITRDLPVHTVDIVTPVSPTKAQELAKDIVLVPILRAGLGMVNGIRDLIPTAKVGHIGLYRDEKTLEPHEYFAKFPSNMPDSIVMVLDPMLATGGSASAAVTMLKKRNAKLIKLVCLVGAPEGVKRMQEDHPDVDIYLAALDEKLNEHGYIVPGLGDAGDRIFGTKQFWFVNLKS